MEMSIIIFIIALSIICLGIFLYHLDQKCKAGQNSTSFRPHRPLARTFHPQINQPEIFTVSGQVQRQETQMDFASNKPPYEDAPPSYEEAIRLAVERSTAPSPAQPSNR